MKASCFASMTSCLKPSTGTRFVLHQLGIAQNEWKPKMDLLNIYDHFCSLLYFYKPLHNCNQSYPGLQYFVPNQDLFYVTKESL